MPNSSKISMEKTSSFLSSPIPHPVEFWIFLVSDALSILCGLFVLFHLLFDRMLRRALHNHVIMVLLFMGLIYELTTVPWHLYGLRYGGPWIQNPIFYIFTYFFDYGLFTIQVMVFAWATIERHILIFHDQWLSTKKKRLFVHYLPIVAILIYCLIYYSLVSFGPFCAQSFEGFLITGVYYPCLFTETALGTWELIGHQSVPTFIIVVFSPALLLRVLWQKVRINQLMRWKKDRKMTIQMLSISSLYLILNSPAGIIFLAAQFGLPRSVTAIPIKYVVFLRYYIIFLFPFICCVSLPELRKKYKRLLPWRFRHRAVADEPLQMARIPHRRNVAINTFAR